jgi:uncharacterized protein
MSKERLTRITAWVRENMVSDGGAHDWFHVQRVTDIARAIGRRENANDELVALCALTHDISDYKLNGGDRMKAAEMARERLAQENVGAEMIESVAEFLEVSGFSRRKSQNREEWSVEWKAVQDADYLDAIGAVGMTRVFWFGGYRGEAIHTESVLPPMEEWADTIASEKSVLAHVQQKLLQLRGLMLTPSGRAIADSRHQRMVTFLAGLVEEWNCSDAERS